MSQDQLRGFILKGLYYLLTKYNQYNTVSCFLTCFVIIFYIIFIIYIRFFIARNFERFAPKFPKLGGLLIPPPPPARTPMGTLGFFIQSLCVHPFERL